MDRSDNIYNPEFDDIKSCNSTIQRNDIIVVIKKLKIKPIIASFSIMFILLWSYASYFDQDTWSISIYAGTNPYEFSPHQELVKTTVLTKSDITDVPADFVADPFMVHNNNVWYMFFEILNASSKQGDIGLATSTDGINWKYEQIVLDEPFHLSYPYVFKWNESYYMIPESVEANSIRLYKADVFPTKWRLVDDLITGKYLDPSIIFKDGKWWLYALKDWDSLTLHYADNPTGPWTGHPKNPLVKGDKNISRPGGRMIDYDDKIIRFVQDGDPSYGNAVRVFQVDEITTTSYKDHEITNYPILKASGNGWNSNGMHHIDPHKIHESKWIACVDGITEEKVFKLKEGAIRIIKKVKSFIKVDL